MKLKRIAVLLLIPAAAWSGETGNFQIENTDFASLFNFSGRAVQPKRVPWAGSYFAYGTRGIANDTHQKPSYSERYDQVFYSGAPKSTDWEKENHSCENVSRELRQGCREWWGHCNAWSAAAIKEEEPRSTLAGSGTEFSVGDQKAYLTELWMDSDSLFAGETDKNTRTGRWIFDPESEKARQPVGYGTGTSYDAFWDVTPRAFFQILSNTVGLMGSSVVIDRFTGDEVWNHPVAGYRMLPIRREDHREPVMRNNRTLYPVLLRMKLYWANDSVPPGHITEGFDITKTTDDERVRVTWPNADEYEGRLLKFTLFFTAPVETNEDGTRVLSAGKIAGEGIWYHQENPVADSDSTHPDFIWMPTVLLNGGGEANPHIRSDVVYKLLEGRAKAGQPEAKMAGFELTFAPDTFRAQTPSSIARTLVHVLKREGIRATVPASGVRIRGDRTVQALVNLFIAGDEPRLVSVLAEAGYMPTRVEPK